MSLFKLNNEEISILLNYWMNVPPIKSVPPDDEAIIMEGVRSQIIQVLREGIEDTDPINNIKVSRYALTAKEIQETINTKFEINITISNIYFHLDKIMKHLDDNQKPVFIQEVLTIKREKQKIKYFGRTAKLFFFSDPDISEMKHEMIQTTISNTTAIINKLHSNINKKEIEKKLDSLLAEEFKAKIQKKDKIITWVQKNSDLLSELDVDIRNMVLFLSNDFTSSKAEKSFLEINKLLGLE